VQHGRKIVFLRREKARKISPGSTHHTRHASCAPRSIRHSPLVSQQVVSLIEKREAAAEREAEMESKGAQIALPLTDERKIMFNLIFNF
jgi:hypothetical protein